MRGATVELGGRPVLEDVDLSVGRGEAVALVGPSGAGKTTLLRLLNGALLPSCGSVRFEGSDLAALPHAKLRAARARVGFVHQDFALVPNLRVVQNVVSGRLGAQGFFRTLRSLVRPPRAELEAVHALLERLGIGDKIFQRTDGLSGGEQQRVALARALYQEPAALLADEPVASVDPTRARALVELLRGLAAERGLTLVVSLHDVGLARAFFPRIVGLRGGRVRFDRATSDVRADAWAALYALEGVFERG